MPKTRKPKTRKSAKIGHSQRAEKKTKNGPRNLSPLLPLTRPRPRKHIPSVCLTRGTFRSQMKYVQFVPPLIITIYFFLTFYNLSLLLVIIDFICLWLFTYYSHLFNARYYITITTHFSHFSHDLVLRFSMFSLSFLWCTTLIMSMQC